MVQKYLAELLGTFILVATILISGNPLFIGLSLAVVVSMIGPISGGHVNPVVTMAVIFNDGISHKEAAGYILAQVLGASLAYAFYRSNKAQLLAGKA